MRVLFQDELTIKVLFERVKKEIKEEQLEKTINYLDYFNKARNNVITKCDLALQKNNNVGKHSKNAKYI